MKKKLPDKNCDYCGRSFTPKRTWQRFCDNSCRQCAFEENESGKRRGNPYEVPCYYCGAIAHGVDHVPPQAVRPTLVSLGLDKRITFVEVKACRECNSLLGARDIWTLTQRKQFIKKALRKRYSKVLKVSSEWADSELKELNGGLQSFVIQRQVAKDLLKARLAW